MAKAPVNRDVAMDVVSESLGLSADDLGVNRDDAFEGMDGLDDEGDDDNDGDESEEITRTRNQENEDDNNEDDLAPQPRQQQQQREQQQPKPRNQQPDYLSVTHTDNQSKKLKVDAKGNILSEDGKKVIASAGREARYYTSLHNERQKVTTIQNLARTEVQRLDTNLQKAVEIGTGLAQQLTTLREAGTAHTRMGLSDQDHQQALEFASAFKKNPVDGIKLILTKAVASGIDLTTLGLAQGGFDPAALMQMVRSEIGTLTKPIQDRNQQETAQQQAQREADEQKNEATRQLNSFLIDNPEAKQYLPVFGRIYENPAYQNMSLNEVWLRIQLNLARNPQQRQEEPRSQRLRNRQQPRLPNGRNNGPNGRERTPQGDDLAPVSQSYEDILRDVMKTA